MDVTHKLLLYNLGPGLRFLAARGRHASDRVSSRRGKHLQDSSALMSHSVTFTRDVLRCGVKYRRYYVTEAASHDGLVQGRDIKTLIMGGAIFI